MSTSKQYLNKVKAERDSAKRQVTSLQGEVEYQRTRIERNTTAYNQSLGEARAQFDRQQATLVAQIEQERSTARLLTQERERAKFNEDRRFDALMNTVVATAVATAQNKYPSPSGSSGVDQVNASTAKMPYPASTTGYPSEIDRPILIGRAR